MSASHYILFKVKAASETFNYIITKKNQFKDHSTITIGQSKKFKHEQEYKFGEVVYMGMHLF